MIFQCYCWVGGALVISRENMYDELGMMRFEVMLCCMFVSDNNHGCCARGLDG